jgi:hypothetical protein
MKREYAEDLTEKVGFQIQDYRWEETRDPNRVALLWAEFSDVDKYGNGTSANFRTMIYNMSNGFKGLSTFEGHIPFVMWQLNAERIVYGTYHDRGGFVDWHEASWIYDFARDVMESIMRGNLLAEAFVADRVGHKFAWRPQSYTLMEFMKSYVETCGD